ncbi:ABC transporter ATP-binding protein [Desulfonema ishimotonii]|uniref:ABC transporter ATP-binding protein n=1 Tax=Desulfonema ishimotonii TaxID=45657 RepID=A0A401G227_9BACT|nr:ATP-binding cassette domain-containing protein [Desulfonema ishimotonii]GBC63288.1 ABC transporter ATP-binding protein [Desulfonema ishimotonii]
MIEVRELTKFFGAKKAVDRISFTVKKGEILGFLGPNGAGKSTSMRMITGFIPPSGGTAVIGGNDILTAPIAARQKIGYLPENAPVYPDMTVSGYLEFCAEVRGFTGAARKKKVEETIEKCFLSGVERQSIGTLSKGYRQRVCFAQSILHDPEYLILDEPTDGLDPNQKHEVRLMIRRMSAEKAIILSTHILDEVDAVCTRAIIIANGRIVADDTPENLRTRSALHGAVSLTLARTDPEKLLNCVRGAEGVGDAKVLEDGSDALKVRIYPRKPDILIAESVMSALTASRYEVRSLFVEQGRLDEVFRSVTTSP